MKISEVKADLKKKGEFEAIELIENMEDDIYDLQEQIEDLKLEKMSLEDDLIECQGHY